MKNKINITVLVDNNAEQGFKAEHGFAVLIEHNEQRILFDTGQCDALFYNAEKLNIKLTELNIIILSHGHYDHGGNLEWLLDNNPSTHLYLHPDCLKTRYSIAHGKEPKMISLPNNVIKAINKHPNDQITFTSLHSQITPAIYLSGEIAKLQPLEALSGPFYLDMQGTTIDPLFDDQSLWLETEQGVVVITGCCHAGIENTVKQVQTLSSTQPIHTILGGLHLHSTNEARLLHNIQFLKSLSLKKLYPAHCSGQRAQNQLTTQLGKKVTHQCKVGLTLSF
ncbi:MAG: MBL fold metallo-hydrolase [Psychromonas sp.]|nr:MBL fold metallo-hydrolase [Psychromonas sp.]